MRHFHNPPLPSKIYPLLYQVRLPESTPSFQNIPPFSTTICNALSMYPALPEYTPLRNATLPESTHPSRIYPLLHHYMRHSHNRPLPPLNILMRHSRNPPPTQNPPFKHLHATLPESTPHSQNIPSFKHSYAMVGHSGIQTFLTKNILPSLRPCTCKY